jgi:hypothetical protein
MAEREDAAKDDGEQDCGGAVLHQTGLAIDVFVVEVAVPGEDRDLHQDHQRREPQP